MYPVDFVVEGDDELVLVEVKDPSASRVPAQNRAQFYQEDGIKRANVPGTGTKGAHVLRIPAPYGQGYEANALRSRYRVGELANRSVSAVEIDRPAAHPSRAGDRDGMEPPNLGRALTLRNPNRRHCPPIRNAPWVFGLR